jgi:hypothetical protein
LGAGLAREVVTDFTSLTARETASILAWARRLKTWPRPARAYDEWSMATDAEVL